MEDAFKLHHRGEVLLPHKVVLDMDERKRGRGNAMPGYVGGDYHAFGIKWIAGFPGNPARFGLPRGTGLTILNDAENGLPLAVMDCTLLSAMRTGAVTGVGARALARPDSASRGHDRRRGAGAHPAGGPEGGAAGPEARCGLTTCAGRRPRPSPPRPARATAWRPAPWTAPRRPCGGPTWWSP